MPYFVPEVRERLLTWECAIFRSDGSREREIAFPATSLLSFLVAQERKCPRGMSGQRKNKRPAAKDSTFKPYGFYAARSQRGPNELCELQAFARGGSGLTKGEH